MKQRKSSYRDWDECWVSQPMEEHLALGLVAYLKRIFKDRPYFKFEARRDGKEWRVWSNDGSNSGNWEFSQTTCAFLAGVLAERGEL